MGSSWIVTNSIWSWIILDYLDFHFIDPSDLLKRTYSDNWNQIIENVRWMKRFCCWTLKNFGEFINNTDWNKARTTSNFEIEQRYEQHYEHLFNPNSWKHVEPLWCIWTSFWRCWWEIPYYSKKFIRITRQLSPAWKNAVIFRFVNDLFINVAIKTPVSLQWMSFSSSSPLSSIAI